MKNKEKDDDDDNDSVDIKYLVNFTIVIQHRWKNTLYIYNIHICII